MHMGWPDSAARIGQWLRWERSGITRRVLWRNSGLHETRWGRRLARCGSYYVL